MFTFTSIQLRDINFSYREQYERRKDVCHELDSHVGSGIIVTAPLVTEDGQPIRDPLVLMEASPSQTPPHSEQVNSPDESTDIMMDKQVINWKLTLHQIGTLVFLSSMLLYVCSRPLLSLMSFVKLRCQCIFPVCVCQHTICANQNKQVL